ncbi:MAG TPA: 30S ribosomal protein S9 [Armatimonadota bacterium]|nr:30S ribosomal protein S9 [Armatimonadota bacterium]HOJ22245.1 30S ribosomal protein S9 [Armatimonadota bacterium]HOM82640.1 30S ribosomal protein S9 [Armatimonadota bacterium]HPO72118.1 30S ribosomal protein S9 [Armatimonadota bacterium]HPT96930.1 30S ribosomal protein S9 [Armatimonadota bacterium]
MAEGIRYYATGHRKNATAKVWLTPGSGNVTVNGRSLESFVGRRALEMIVRQPFEVTGSTERFDVIAKTLGGGISGQAGAIRHGIAKALVIADENLKPTLRRLGFLTRDPRVKERKKYGRKRARRGFQFSKR